MAKKQTLGQQIYQKQIKRIERYIKKKEKEGYVFKDKESLIPKMPKRVTQKAIERITSFKSRSLLENATKESVQRIEQIKEYQREQKLQEARIKAEENIRKSPEKSVLEIADEVTAKTEGTEYWNGEYYEGEGWIAEKIKEADERRRLEESDKISIDEIVEEIKDDPQKIEELRQKLYDEGVQIEREELADWYQYERDKFYEPRHGINFERVEKKSDEPVDFVDAVLSTVEDMIDTYDSYVSSQSQWGDFFKEEKLRYSTTLRNILNGAINSFGREKVALNCERNAIQLIQIINEILYDSGGGSNKDNYYNTINSRIVEFAEILKGSALTLEENEQFTELTPDDEGDEYEY